jgi:hypothetical protein
MQAKIDSMREKNPKAAIPPFYQSEISNLNMQIESLEN